MDLNKKSTLEILELLIVFAVFSLICVIYIPISIWNEESVFEKESRFRMRNLYDLEEFYNELTGSYTKDYNEAVMVVNSVRDSIVADSLYLGEQKLLLFGKEYNIDVSDDFSFEFDTTFGFQKFRKDTVLDTVLTVVVYSKDLSRNDTSFTQKRYLDDYSSNPDFMGVINEEFVERVEKVEYYQTFLPDSLTYFCPLINQQYDININDDNSGFRIASPIKELYTENRYLFFSFKARSHGYISDGNPSWD